MQRPMTFVAVAHPGRSATPYSEVTMASTHSSPALRLTPKRVGVLALCAALLAALFAVVVPTTAPAGSAVSAPTAQASVIGLKITNIGSRSLGICKDWRHPSGVWTSSSCSGGSSQGVLYKNQNSKSKYGWSDTDGIRVDKGYRIKERIKYTSKGDTFYRYVNVTTCTHKATYWLKVQPSVQRTTRYFYHKKC